MIAGLATTQQGVVARWQLVARGVTRHEIDTRVARRTLHEIYRGVYAVGHTAISKHALWKAATLAARAPLSHRAAAALWEVRQSSAVEVTVGRTRSCRAQFVVHRLDLAHDEVSERNGIAVTTITRTLFDIAAGLPFHQFERAANEAEYQRLVDHLTLDDLVARYPRRPGTKNVRRLLAGQAVGAAWSRSDLEAAFLAFLDDHGLPRPRTNFHVAIAGRLIECDCVWPRQRLIVELDGYAAHGTRRAFERDRATSRALIVGGWRVVRVTPRQLDKALAADLLALLAAPSAIISAQ